MKIGHSNSQLKTSTKRQLRLIPIYRSGTYTSLHVISDFNSLYLNDSEGLKTQNNLHDEGLEGVARKATTKRT